MFYLRKGPRSRRREIYSSYEQHGQEDRKAKRPSKCPKAINSVREEVIRVAKGSGRGKGNFCSSKAMSKISSNTTKTRPSLRRMPRE